MPIRLQVMSTVKDPLSVQKMITLCSPLFLNNRNWFDGISEYEATKLVANIAGAVFYLECLTYYQPL